MAAFTDRDQVFERFVPNMFISLMVALFCRLQLAHLADEAVTLENLLSTRFPFGRCEILFIPRKPFVALATAPRLPI